MMETIFIVVIIIIALLFIAFVSTYNKLIRQIEAIRNNLRQIDIQLDRRFKVFESLIEVVKKYMDYEKTTLKEVVALRSQAVKSATTGDQHGRIQAEDAISRIAANINLMFERYPDLKANQNALQLQEEIINSENKLAYAKQAYNASIELYNATKNSFFQSIVVNWAAEKLNKPFEYWRLSEEGIAAKEAYTVKL